MTQYHFSQLQLDYAVTDYFPWKKFSTAGILYLFAGRSVRLEGFTGKLGYV